MKTYLLILLFIVNCITVRSQNLPPYLPANGLVAWYPFNGNSNDESGGENHGTAVGGAILSSDRFGNPDKAFSFDGSGYIYGSSSNFPSGARSISMWYYGIDIGVGTNGKQLFGYGGGPCGSGWIVNFDNPDQNVGPGNIEVQGHCLSFRKYSAYPNPINQSWHHVVVTYDGITLKFYFDGVLRDSYLVTVATTNISGKQFGIGAYVNESGLVPYTHAVWPWFKGKVDDIAVFNRSLSDQEIINLYTAPIPPIITSFSPQSGPVGMTVTITGTGFSTTLANNIVWFGATKAVVTGATSTTLTVIVPIAAAYQPITVTVNGLTAYSKKTFLVTFPGGVNLDANSFASKVDFPTGANSHDTVIGDIDGDGKPDVVITKAGSNTVSIFRNTSIAGTVTTASFASKVDFATGASPIRASIGDVDGDGRLDLVVANQLGNSVSVLRNTSTSGFINSSSFAAKADFAAGNSPYGTAIVDVDGDGRAEIIVTNYLSNSVSVLRNIGAAGSITAGTFAPKVDFSMGSANARAPSIGDIDGDGKPDIVVASDNNNTVSVFRNTSTTGSITASSFAPKVDFATGSNPFDAAIGDVDGDGKLDLVVPNFVSSTVSVFRNTSSAGSITTNSFSQRVDFTTGSSAIEAAIGDFDGDGKPDFIVANYYSNTVSVFKNNSTQGAITSSSFASKVDFATGTNPYGTAIGDVDGDGKPDLLVTNKGSSTVSVLRNATLTSQVISFSPLASKVYRDAPFDLAATSTSGLSITYASSDPSIASIVGNTVTVKKAGTITITAAQNGNAIYAPAVSAEQTLVIQKADQIISFTSLTSVSETIDTFTVNATSTSGLSVNFNSSNTDKISIDQNVVTVHKPGSVTITASQDGDDNYNAAESIGQTICILPQKPVITAVGLDSENAVLTSSSVNGNQWYRNETILTGATSQTHSIKEEGVYQVKVTIDGCASEKSDQYSIIVTDIIDAEDTRSINLYPNPAGQELRIELTGVQESEFSELIAYDLTGKVITKQTMKGKSLSFLIDQFPSGNYVLHISNRYFVLSARFTKR